MLRRVLLGVIAVTAALMLVWVGWGRVRPVGDLPQDAAQNVLLVTVDTLRADALGCYGGRAATPQIDALAAIGLRFTFAHAHAVVTLPSHASILTGRYPFDHGYRQNGGSRLAAGTRTLPQRLMTKGVATAAFIGAFPLDARFGLTGGFDLYDGRFDDMAGAAAFALPERSAVDVVARASGWIATQRDHQWFAWVHVFDPHAPYVPPAPFDREFANDPYLGEVSAVDRALTPLITQVDGLSRPTVIVITSDHGEALGDHGETTHGLFAYESTLRVPLIVARVGGSGRGRSSGTVVDIPAQHVDIVPTVLDLLGEAPESSLPGRSLRTRDLRSRSAMRASYFEAMSSMLQFGWAPLQGVVAGREKYIDLPLPELYDLAIDPAEQANLFGTRTERSRVLAARLSDHHATLPGAQQREDPDVVARLRALGYVSGGAPRKTSYGESDDPKRLVALDRLLHDAVAQDAAGAVEGAMAKYREILASRPDMTSAARHLAFDHWKRGEAAEAIATIEAALRAGAPTVGAQVQLATYLSDTGSVEKAIALLQPLADGADPDLDAINALAIAYARRGDRRLAQQTFEQGLRIDPRSSLIHENLGALALEQGDLSSARGAFQRALDGNPESSQAHAGLAMVAFRSGARGEAIERWRRAVSLDPTNYDALYNLALQLIKTGHLVDGRKAIDTFVRTAPRGLYQRDIHELGAMLKTLPQD
jgi:arylsulfatase A-like enzyme/tetratricopeptide (TPR) repeat protein